MNISTFYSVIIGEIDLHILAEPTGVIIPYSFTIAKGLEQRITTEYPVLNLVFAIGAKTRKYLHAILGGLRLASPTFARNDNSLLGHGPFHMKIRLARNHINVWWLCLDLLLTDEFTRLE